MLTRGDTIPPNANPVAPNKAEAVPEFCRSLSIAKVVDAEKVSPIVKSRKNNSISLNDKRTIITECNEFDCRENNHSYTAKENGMFGTFKFYR